MRTLQQIKDEVAREWFDRNAPYVSDVNKTWKQLTTSDAYHLVDIVADRFAHEVALDSLERAAENVRKEPNILFELDTVLEIVVDRSNIVIP